jgi:DNA-binding CsgD family transcriptional regulator
MERGIFRGLLDDEQRDIFSLISAGKSTRGIAETLGLPTERVEAVVRKTCRQLGVDTRKAAARVLATHYGWKMDPAIAAGQARPRMAGHFGSELADNATKTEQTEREHVTNPSYVENVGKKGSLLSLNLDKLGKEARRTDVTKQKNGMPFLQRILLIALLIASCSLALSALISAMQGFETLVFS